MASYRGIEFAKGYNKSFAEFKKEFGGTYVFKNIHPDDLDNELKTAYKIANPNGKLPSVRKKSKKDNTAESTEGTI